MQDNRQQTIEFKYTGLDQDSDQRLMNPGDSRYRLNCINDSTDDGLLGDIQNIKGNAIYPYDAPAGTNKVIGSCKDTQNNAILFFVYNSNGDHQIRRFYPDTLANELILQSEELNFQANFRIYHANIINGLLYWTDGWFEDFEYGSNNKLNYNPPRKINIQKAIDGDPGYSPITFETLDRIKYQPPYPPTLRFASDSSIGYNYLYGKLYQAAYRYICDDKEITTWSSLSKVLLPAYTYKDQSPFSLYENTIELTFYTGSEIVTDIEIAMRVNNSYFIISRLNKVEESIGDNTNFTYTYDGTAYKENLLAEDFLRPFDYVPQVSKSQDIVGGRVTDGNVTENYDNVDIDVAGSFIRYDKQAWLYGGDTEVRQTSQDISTFPTYGVQWGNNLDAQYPICTFKSDAVYQYGIVYYDRAGRSGVVNTKEEYIINTPQYDVGAFPLNGMIMDPLKLRLTIDNPPPIWAKYYQVVITKQLSYIKKTMFAISAFNYDSREGTFMIPTSTGYTLTDGDRIRLVAYNSVDVPYLSDNYPIFVADENIVSNNGGMLPWRDLNGDQINNLYTTVGSTFDYKIESFDPGTTKAKISIIDNMDAQNYILGFREKAWASGNFFYVVEIYNKNRDETENKVFYEVGEKYEIGDAYTATRYHKGGVQDQTTLQPAIVDIFGFDAYLREKKQSLDQQNFFSNSAWGITRGLFSTGLLETTWYIPKNTLPVYQGLDTTQCIPFDLGGGPNPVSNLVESLNEPTFGNDGQDYFAFITNPEMTGLIGNFYGFVINGTIEIKAWVEDEAFADDYPSTTYNDGRVNSNLETLGRKNYISRLRWSGQLFENTLTNELSTVFEGSYKDLSETYNEISRIRQVGDTLRVRQKNKMSSFYIDKNMLNVNEGVANVGQSADFLSTPNLYDEYYGSSTPGSDSISTRTTYFMDLLHGLIIRDAGNKPIPISGDDDNPNDQFKMAKFFRDLCKNIRAVGEDSFNIISCWDEFSSLYTLTVQDLRTVFNTIPDQSMTIVFHEPTNRWKSFMSYIPEWYETMGQFLVSFKNAQPYLHYTNPTRNNFFGTQYGQEIRVTANIARNTVKIFNNLDVYSNIAWEIPTINIPSTPNSPNGMLSALPAARFKAKEGVWHASFLRDKNDPKYPIAPLALINGRRLRGETIELVMTNTSTSLVYLRALNIYINPSELTL